MLPYASAKPHDQAECQHCGPRGQGHRLCQNPNCPGSGENGGAGRIATQMTLRHATEAEYAALPLSLTPIDGVARQAVFACDDCAEDALDPFCQHPEPDPVPCPTCGVADPASPCLKKDGATALPFRHSGRTDPPREICAHAHRPDCGVFDDCQCSADDQPPQRPPHPAAPDGQFAPDVTRLLFDEAYAQIMLADKGVHWWQVREVASCFTQDNQPAMRAVYATVDERGHLVHDEHGHEVTAETVIVIARPDQP